MDGATNSVVEFNKDIEIVAGVIYDGALEQLKEKVGDLAIHSTSLPLIIKYVIEIIEGTPIKGPAQKDMALKLMRAVIVDLTDGEDEKVLTKLLDDGTVSNLIELVIDATKGKLDVNVAVVVVSGCLSRFGPYVVKKVKQLRGK
ncbi:hypothetical protein PGAG_00339 [Phaeocystis globosa virus 12T]|uniref:Uncharacterized protein n=1 Tax=Phaeocystis globosa virus PgV-16T TaxID=3071227 RepID=A0AC59EXK2_9VIRU|nr:hypothetical protein PGCG_00384 [Phaeocystis globosa virus]AET73228.1 hypothetical protein PGAG_00339 [Phaeocystis globosa virus 12T]AET73704.1 hypothetical protein PGBG_00393 [Phaeocystis globosa virus 14T]AGM15688.1 hypothetical protein PGCG_00384 [Phaeocystis globosa virus PgV-16T]UYE94418.1 hypothetical protein PGV14T_00384 [Phaeocystis globosa virus]